MKKCLSLLLALLMLVAIIPATSMTVIANAAETTGANFLNGATDILTINEWLDDLTNLDYADVFVNSDSQDDIYVQNQMSDAPVFSYTLNDMNEATITGYSADPSYMEIPSTVDGYTVVTIGENSFKNKQMETLVLPDTVKVIEAYAFSNCLNLKNITLPQNLEKMYGQAFEKCTALAEITIPKSLSYVTDPANTSSPNYPGYYAQGPFMYCSNLKTITFEEGTTQIPKMLFGGCDGLEKIEIPKTVTTIGDGAFCKCTALKEIIIPDLVTTIGHNVFSGCKNLQNIEIASSVTEMGEGIFQNCVSLTEIILPDNLKTIYEYTFEGCTSLTNVKLPQNLEKMYGEAFKNCSALKEITIPKSLNFVTDPVNLSSPNYPGYYVQGPFMYCSNLKTITFEEGTTQIPKMLFGGCDGLEKIEIPKTVTTIGDGAFYECTALKEVVIPDLVTTIGHYAFSGCKNLPNIEIPSSVTGMGQGVFKGCISLAEIILPDNLKTINASTFSGCTGLTNVELPQNLEKMYGKAFENCTALEEITIPKSLSYVTDPTNTSSPNYPGNYRVGPFIDCFNLKTVTFEEGTTQIPKMLFGGCDSLEEIEIPDTVTTIGDGVFYECTALKEIVIPDSVKEMGAHVFAGCTSLESVKLPSSRISILKQTFYNCSSLKTIELPKTVENIREYAFYGCSSLENLNFEDTSLKVIERFAFQNCSSLKAAVLPETVTEIGNQAFMGCSALEKVYIPESTKTLGTAVFSGCEALSDVTIKDYGVTTIGSSTFKDCASLKKIELPKGLTTIGNSAFMNAISLEEIIIPESVTSIDSTAFSYPGKTTIYGKIGSFAETFATENGFKFVPNEIVTEGILIKGGNEQLVLEQGETYRASFEIYPEDANEVISLTPDNNKVTINGHDIYARYSGDTVITASTKSGFNYDFNVHIRAVSNIEIVTNPQKTTYSIDEEFDKTGMVVRVNYDDNTTKDVVNYTVEGFDSSVEGTNTVTIKWTSVYGVTYKATLELNIVDLRPKLTEIFIDTLPTKLTYELREKIDCTGLVITGLYTDGSIQEITDYTVSGYNALKTGVQTVTVKSGAFSTTFTVAVGVTRNFDCYEVIEKDNNFNRYVGENFTERDVKLKIVYDDGSCNTIGTGFSISTVDTSKAGEKKIELYYGDEIVVFTVNVESLFAIPSIETEICDGNIVIDTTNISGTEQLLEVEEGYTAELQESFVYGNTRHLGTGSVIKVFDEDENLVMEYNVVVRGDINGDSVCDVLDCMLLELAQSDNITLEGVYFAAGDLSEDNEITVEDFSAVVNKALSA